MSTETTNYKLKKPELSDSVAQTMGVDIPSNLTSIDTLIKAANDAISALTVALASISADDIGAGTLDLDTIDIANSDDSVSITDSGVDITGGKFSYKNRAEVSIIDDYGIDPRYFDYFKNMINNSSFELFDESTLTPSYWTGSGVSDPNSSFRGSYSCKLTAGQYIETNSDAYINPAFFDNEESRISFHRKLGTFKLEVYDVTNSAYFTLTDEDGVTGSSITFSNSSNWQGSRASAKFDPTQHGTCTEIKVKLTNVHASETGYADAVMLTPDYNGKYPQIYKDGAKSSGVDGTYQAIVVSDTEPTDTSVLWLDIS